MPVTHTLVSLIKELVPGYLVFLDIPFHQVEVPREQGIQFNQPRRICLKRPKIRPVAALGCTSSRYH